MLDINFTSKVEEYNRLEKQVAETKRSMEQAEKQFQQRVADHEAMVKKLTDAEAQIRKLARELA